MTRDPDSLHRRAWHAIPWVVAGTASADERLWVEQHVATCDDCREERALQQRIHAGLLEDVPPVCDPEPSLQRLLARIDVAANAPARAAHPPDRSWTRWLAAACLVQAVGLTALGIALSDRIGKAEYQTLGRPAARNVSATIRVVPAPGMDFGRLRLLLARTQTSIVESSADATSFGLALRGDISTSTAAVLQDLRASPDLLLVEPIARDD